LRFPRSQYQLFLKVVDATVKSTQYALLVQVPLVWLLPAG
jgi:hypothetical protein